MIFTLSRLMPLRAFYAQCPYELGLLLALHPRLSDVTATHPIGPLIARTADGLSCFDSFGSGCRPRFLISCVQARGGE
jgi:hypothetical protein